ncbi:hypothetical protein [Sphingomicrobium aestuariivivum]|uniref:hypothetical protein n=1 Tax=Sphingomicrobium aestuariivivum TaxID=1582356 RepID=UPI001FD65C14|nr:hypothetical protein [Sphingomicrobium aestuariivivum]MCJ8191031.1 hypothetical protein [Sphingomicrobium aestuariivivum]
MSAEAAPWWERREYLFLLLAVSLLPTLLPVAMGGMPPLVDLPFHYARFAIGHGGEGAAYWAPYFEHGFKFTGNIGGDLLVAALAPVIGVSAATKLIVCLIPPLWVGASWWLSREVLGRVAPAIGIVPAFAFAQPFLYGFVNYTLSIGLALAALALWVRWGRQGHVARRALAFLPIALLVYLAHPYGWGVLGIGAFAAEWDRRRREGAGHWPALWRGALATWPLFLPFVHLGYWFVTSDVVTGNAGYDFSIERKLTAIGTLFLDQWRWLDLAMASMTVLLLVGATLSNDFAWRRTMLLWFAGLLTLVFFAMPRVLFGSAFSDFRMAPVMLLAFFLALDGVRRKDRALIAAVALGFGLLKLATTSASTLIWSDRIAAQRAVIADLAPGTRLFAHYAPRECRTIWPLRRNAHIGGFHIAENSGYANNMWEISEASPLKLREAADRTKSDPHTFAWSDNCETRAPALFRAILEDLPRERYDYVWLVDAGMPAGMDEDFRLVREGGGSALYEIRR